MMYLYLYIHLSILHISKHIYSRSGMLTSEHVWLLPDGAENIISSASVTLKAELVKATLLMVKPSSGSGSKYDTFVTTLAGKNPTE